MLQLCIVILCLGAASSAPVAEQKFKFLDSSTSLQTVRLGSSTIIDCETTDASAVVTLWKVKQGKRVHVQPDYDLIQSGQIFTKHNIVLEDAGTYKCRAQDSMSKKIMKDVHVIINTARPSLSLQPSRPVITLTGSTVSFTCEAVGGRLVSWKHIPSTTQNHPRPSKYTIKQNVNGSTFISILTLPNAQISNSGMYECWLYQYDTSIVRYVDLLVKDPKTPAITKSNNEIKIVKLGKSEHLNCDATGIPTPVITWEKDGRPISLCRRLFLNTCQGSPYRYQPDGMKIESARFPQDNGTYTCVAKNSAGVTRKNFSVIVGVKPVLDKSSSLLMKSSIVTCHAKKGNPPPKFTWSMQLYWFPSTPSPDNDRWFPISRYGNRAITSSDGMTSTIHMPYLITRAFYKCKAVNKAGRDSHTFKVMRMY